MSHRLGLISTQGWLADGADIKSVSTEGWFDLPQPAPSGETTILLWVAGKKCKHKDADARRCLDDEEFEELIALGLI